LLDMVVVIFQLPWFEKHSVERTVCESSNSDEAERAAQRVAFRCAEGGKRVLTFPLGMRC
jgi:hypothetical protein